VKTKVPRGAVYVYIWLLCTNTENISRIKMMQTKSVELKG